LLFFADRPPIFGAIPTARWLRQRRPIMRAADLNCGRENGLEERFQVLEDFKFVIWNNFKKFRKIKLIFTKD
jgi:hypothetical protein